MSALATTEHFNEAPTLVLSEELEIAQPTLRAVPKPEQGRAPGIISMVVAAGILLAAFLIQFLFAQGITQGAFELDELSQRQVKLSEQERSLKNELGRVVSPQYLAANAEVLGMIPSNSTSYLRLSDQAIFGVPASTTANPIGAKVAIANQLSEGQPLTPAAQKVIAQQAMASAQAAAALAAAQKAAEDQAAQAAKQKAQQTQNPPQDPRPAMQLAETLPVPVTH